MKLQLGDVRARGDERIDNPTCWPIYFALDDTTLRFLAGDVAASDWMHAPGAAAPGSELVWQHDFPDYGASLQYGRIGYGLLYSAGGANDAATQSAYQTLVATVHALVLGHAAQENGMAALLAAFGGRYAPDDSVKSPNLDVLTDGIDPIRLADEVDTSLTQGLEVFRTVAEDLMPLVPGVAVPAERARLKPAKPITRVYTPTVAARFRPVFPFGPVFPPRASTVTPGTVVAVTLQAWRVSEIPLDKPIKFARPLPTRDALRASLRLSGRLSRGT